MYYVGCLALALVASIIAGIGMDYYAEGDKYLGISLAMLGHIGIYKIVEQFMKKMGEVAKKDPSPDDQA